MSYIAKTIGQLAKEQLTEIEFEKFKTNCSDSKCNPREYESDLLNETLSDYPVMNNFVAVSFVWDRTPEGHDYWQEIYNRINV